MSPKMPGMFAFSASEPIQSPWSMDEPSILTPEGAVAAREPAKRASAPARSTADATMVTVAGFWRRALAAAIDAAVALPVAALFAWIAGKIAGVTIPGARRTGIDYWLDLAIAGEPALWGTVGLMIAIVTIYLLVFQLTMARTLGMRVLRLRIIDLYGEPPSVVRAIARTFGYLVAAATFCLGFVWIGFDREKRGLHDWIAGTYVIREEGRR